jgi:hypothetical protein
MYSPRLLSMNLAFGGLLATSLFAFGASNPHPGAPPQTNHNRTEAHSRTPAGNTVHESSSPARNPDNRFAENRFAENRFADRWAFEHRFAERRAFENKRAERRAFENWQERANENLNGRSQPGGQNPTALNNQNSNQNGKNVNQSKGNGDGDTGNDFAKGNSTNGKGINRLELLEEASFELRSAYATLAKINENGANPHHSIEKAIHHLEIVMQDHQEHQMHMHRSGVSGAISEGAHHQHHKHLEEALHEARAAHRQLGMGEVPEAKEEVARAHHHVDRAIEGHEALMGR